MSVCACRTVRSGVVLRVFVGCMPGVCGCGLVGVSVGSVGARAVLGLRFVVLTSVCLSPPFSCACAAFLARPSAVSLVLVPLCVSSLRRLCCCGCSCLALARSSRCARAVGTPPALVRPWVWRLRFAWCVMRVRALGSRGLCVCVRVCLGERVRLRVSHGAVGLFCACLRGCVWLAFGGGGG